MIYHYYEYVQIIRKFAPPTNDPSREGGTVSNVAMWEWGLYVSNS
jgi:hypothetical protein